MTVRRTGLGTSQASLVDVLLLGTIISIHENPFPGQQDKLEPEQQYALSVIRRNLHNVFGQLSKATDGRKEPNPIMTLPIRGGLTSGLGDTKDSNIGPLADASSLLFYYLFDDWYTSYSLVARKEHQYGAQLTHLVRRLRNLFVF